MEPGVAGAAAPAPLFVLGWIHVALAALALAAAVWLWRRISQLGFRRALTWDCGYVAPVARMQYTAGSFAGIITEWFASILRPTRHEQRPEGVFPAVASFETHTPETVLEHVVAPVGGMILQVAVAARRLQHGRLQVYLLYVLVGVAVLAGLVMFGGGR